MEKNNYLCTVKNASAGLKSALNVKFAFFGMVKLSNSKIKKWIKLSTTTELLRLTSRKR